MIEVISLHKKFDQDYILNDINTVFEKGKTNLIIGQSGSGKTVLLKCLLGLYNINSGEISYDGIHSSEMDSNNKLELRREMGMVFQGSALFDSLNVIENVRFPLDMLTQLDTDEKNKRALKFIERSMVHLNIHLSAHKQRLLIAIQTLLKAQSIFTT